VVDATAYLAGLRTLFTPFIGLALITCLGAAIALWLMLVGGRTAQERRLRNLLLAAVATQLVGFAIVARQAEPHYVLPVVPLTGVIFAACATVLRERSAATAARWVLTAAAAVIVAAAGRDVYERQSALAAMRDAQVSVHDRVAREFPDAPIIYYYRASSLAFALHYGSMYSSNSWSRRIERIHQRAWSYNILSGKRDDVRVPDAAVAHAMASIEGSVSREEGALPKPSVVLQGTPLDRSPLTLPLLGRVRLVYSAGLEACYVVP